MKHFKRIAIGIGIVGVVVAGTLVAYNNWPTPGHPSAYTPPDTSLQRSWMYYYPARAELPARAVIFFIGNDVAFWNPHQQLAWWMSGQGYSVIGLDVRQWLETLPSAEPARDSAFGAAIGPLIARTRHALNADSLPLVLAGHSFGAELAFWIAWHHPPPGLVGVLAMNPRGSGHLFITPEDWLNHEASGPWSFSTIQAAASIDSTVRIALVRAASDPFRKHDPAFVAAGGQRLKLFMVKFAGHSLTRLIMAKPVIRDALDFLLAPRGR